MTKWVESGPQISLVGGALDSMTKLPEFSPPLPRYPLFLFTPESQEFQIEMPMDTGNSDGRHDITSFLVLVVMPFVTSSFLFLVVVSGATSNSSISYIYI